MVKVSSSKSKSNNNKIPALKVTQVLIALVIGCYVAIVIQAGHVQKQRGPIVEERQSPDSVGVTVNSVGDGAHNERALKVAADNTAKAPTTTTSKSDAAAPITIGYAVSVTGCGSDPLEEGAAVLKHSIHLASIHGPLGGRYDYKMYAIYHPNAAGCSAPLAELGYELLERNTPIAVSDIEGEFLRSKIEQNGCCGEKELIKLEAYTLTQHPVVVHLDLDVLVLQPLDYLFDAMILGPNFDPTGKITVQWPQKPFPARVNAFITRDYNMHPPSAKHAPVQGGFLVVRPDMDVYQEFLAIIKKGDFRHGSGWGGQVGAFYGGMTIQGLVPYYYDILHPDVVVELDHCVYNQMCINPRDKPTVNDVVNGRCRTGEEDCQDCRSLPLEKVVTTHFTLCQKPWWCLPHDADRIQERLCRKLLHEWFRIRSELEKSWGRSGMGDNPQWKQTDHFFGYCSNGGHSGYTPIAKPYGQPIASSQQ